MRLTIMTPTVMATVTITCIIHMMTRRTAVGHRRRAGLFWLPGPDFWRRSHR